MAGDWSGSGETLWRESGRRYRARSMLITSSRCRCESKPGSVWVIVEDTPAINIEIWNRSMTAFKAAVEQAEEEVT